MPIQYFYSEPDNVLCVKINAPVVLAEDEVQVIVDNIAILPELAQKVDHIDARLQDFDARPIFVHEDGDSWISVIEEEGWERFGWHWQEHHQPVVKKVLVSGTLHKQIFYVSKNDIVKHVGEDIPFAKDVTLDVAQPVVNENNVYVKIHHKKIDMRWDLQRGSTLRQTGVMIFQVKVIEDRQIFVQICPRLNPRCQRGGNEVKDGRFESWGTSTNPIFWEGGNVQQHGSVLLGATPSQPAYLYQNILVTPNCEYRLCFDAEEITGYQQAQVGTTSYSLTVELFFFNRFGVVIDSETKSWNASQIPDGRFTNFCLTGVSPEESREALVRFSFIPVNHVGSARGCLRPSCKPPLHPPCVPPIPPPCLPPPCIPPMPPPIPPPCVPPAPGIPINTSAVVIDNVVMECMRELT